MERRNQSLGTIETGPSFTRESWEAAPPFATALGGFWSISRAYKAGADQQREEREVLLRFALIIFPSKF
jgi:hypothetical protein